MNSDSEADVCPHQFAPPKMSTKKHSKVWSHLMQKLKKPSSKVDPKIDMEMIWGACDRTPPRKKSPIPIFCVSHFTTKSPKHYHRWKQQVFAISTPWPFLATSMPGPTMNPQKIDLLGHESVTTCHFSSYPSVPRKGRPRWQLIHLSRARQKHRLGSLELLLHQQVDPGGLTDLCLMNILFIFGQLMLSMVVSGSPNGW